MVQDFTRMMEETAAQRRAQECPPASASMLASYAHAAEARRSWPTGQMPQAGTLEHDPMCEEAPITASSPDLRIR